MTQIRYTTALAKGQGMIDETIALLDVWQPGMTARDLANLAVSNSILSRATAKRARDMVIEQFAPRYLADNSRPAKQIKALMGSGIPAARLKQVFLLYTARANVVLHDFICNTYWHKYEAGQTTVSKDDALSFLVSAANAGHIPGGWSTTMTDRVASYLGGCLVDFGLVEKGRKGRYGIIPFRIDRLIALYLAHDVHHSGYSDNGVIEHQDWGLFGLKGTDVVHELQRVSNGHFIPQFSGELMRISWSYDTMEEALLAITAAELR